ncbi:MAG: hypothetical protein Kow0010_18970 [Dehalococcoidia bacterium]
MRLSFLAAGAIVSLLLVAGCSQREDPPITVARVTPTPAVTPGNGGADNPTAPPSTAGPSATPEPPDEPTATPTPATGPGGGSLVTVACGDPLAPLDKQHRLPANCVPADLVTVPGAYSSGGHQLTAATVDALVEMLDAAAAEGHVMVVVSAYRSYAQQEATYNWHVDTFGQAYADRVSARPGHSEHQLGTTADLSSASVGYELTEAFGDTPEGLWLAENSWKFGFIISYPAGKEHITGYAYEPWHVRYVGKDIAAQVHASGLTLHEFLLR